MRLGAIVDVLRRGGTVLIGVARHSQWRPAVDPIVDEALRLQLQPHLFTAHLELRVKTGGVARVILESDPHAGRGLNADAIVFPFGAGEDFRREMARTLLQRKGVEL